MPSLKRTQGTLKKPPRTKDAGHAFIDACRAFESSRILQIESSRTLAWRVALGACVICLGQAIAIIFMLPLKETQPYLVRVDNNTGNTDLVTMLSTDLIDQDHALARYFSAMYVRLMEGYDWLTLQNDVERLLLFSDPNLQSRINTSFELPSSPLNVYKDQMRAEIEINNITRLDEQGIMQVRFTKTVTPVHGGSYNPNTQTMTPEPIVTRHIATLGYEFINAPKDDKVRLVNPLGFYVVSYRVDNEI